MIEILVSEKNGNDRFIAYIYGALLSLLDVCGARAELSVDSERTAVTIHAQTVFEKKIRTCITERIAEVISVGYKYRFFREKIKTVGLSSEDNEILLAALISADLKEDRRYIALRLQEVTNYSIDGFYSFRLGLLRKKWQNVAECVPDYFTKERLRAFMSYLIRGEGNGKIFIRNAEIYDEKYRKLHRAALIDGGGTELTPLREIILSGAGEIECVTALSAKQEEFLKKYYAGKVSFY